LIRLHFAKRDETLSAAGERLAMVREKAKQVRFAAKS
jgi:hypothetical protein